MNWRQRKTYVVAMVNKSQTKHKTTQGISRRQTSFFYHLKVGEKLLPVCQKLFLTTLGLAKWSVRNWVNRSCAGVPKITENFLKKPRRYMKIDARKSESFSKNFLNSHLTTAELRAANYTLNHCLHLILMFMKFIRKKLNIPVVMMFSWQK